MIYKALDGMPCGTCGDVAQLITLTKKDVERLMPRLVNKGTVRLVFKKGTRNLHGNKANVYAVNDGRDISFQLKLKKAVPVRTGRNNTPPPGEVDVIFK